MKVNCKMGIMYTYYNVGVQTSSCSLIVMGRILSNGFGNIVGKLYSLEHWV